MTTIVTLVGLLVGTFLVAIGWRGRRLDDHPVCRRCRYDLSGVAAPRERCPECGRELTSPRSVVIGRRRRRWGQVIAGFLICVTTAAAGAFWMSRNNVNWYARQADWMLRLEARHGWQSLEDGALGELYQRLVAGTLDPKVTAQLVEDALAVQGDLTRPWSPAWGDFFESVWSSGRVAKADVTRYFEQATTASLVLEARPRVHPGTRVPLRASVPSYRAGQRGRYLHEVDEWRLLVDGETVGREDTTSSRTASALTDGGHAEFWTQSELDLGEGSRDVVIEVDMSAVAAGRRRGRQPPEVLAQWTVRQKVPVEVVPPHEPVVEIIDDPNQTDAVRSAIWLTRVLVRDQATQRTGNARLPVGIDRPPLDGAWDLVAYGEGGRWALGQLVARAGETFEVEVTGRRGVRIPAGLESVDIVLTPDARAAASTVDLVTIWGGDLRFEDVPVRYERRPDDPFLEAARSSGFRPRGQGPDLAATGDQLTAQQLQTLWQRVERNEIGDDEMGGVIRRLLKRQADPEQQWLTSCDKIIQSAWQGGRLDPGLALQYIRQAVEPALRLRIRERMRPAPMVAFRLQVDREAMRGEFKRSLLPELTVNTVRLDGTPLPDAPVRRGGDRSRRITQTGYDARVQPTIGAHELAVDVRVRLPGVGRRLGVKTGLDEDGAVTWRTTLAAPFLVVAPGEPLAAPADGPDHNAILRAALNDLEQRLYVSADAMVATGSLSLAALPFDLSADMYWRTDDGEWLVGQVMVPAGRGQQVSNTLPIKRFDPSTRRVELVLRSNDQQDHWGFGFSDLRWEGELVIDPVLLSRPERR